MSLPPGSSGVSSRVTGNCGCRNPSRTRLPGHASFKGSFTKGSSRLFLDQVVAGIAYVIMGESWHYHDGKAVCVRRDFQRSSSVMLSVSVPCLKLGTRAACTAGQRTKYVIQQQGQVNASAAVSVLGAWGSAIPRWEQSLGKMVGMDFFHLSPGSGDSEF